MKKANFDLGKAAATPVSGRAIEAARKVLERHKPILQAPGVFGVWVGAKSSRPYIMVAVGPNGSAKLQQSIPDSLEGVNVYYVEGTPG